MKEIAMAATAAAAAVTYILVVSRFIKSYLCLTISFQSHIDTESAFPLSFCMSLFIIWSCFSMCSIIILIKM
ncbi:hypothetical protein I7I50_02632 [Histoplasma capsulatum G186AR]|uniref:Uncharacterized protein n=1 Tax=Ajellomyces capsulatus TaxID=5037 RepID=A0A8H7Z837_AJECA|nr:hypothetical protein I7I52_00705 [Histoplasma capsulatum]QSS71692.1 hypothetical protein I7I50_02632 [Histoplasma capsulatum G186AR]